MPCTGRIHDGHDTGVRAADRWLAETFGPRLPDRRFTANLLFIVTFDEGASLVAPAITSTTVVFGGRRDARLGPTRDTITTVYCARLKPSSVSGLWADRTRRRP